MATFAVGTYINNNGKKADARNLPYLRICSGPQRGKYVHTLVAEAKIGRELLVCETVDHLDGDYQNNAPENLEVVTRRENTRRMRARRRCEEVPL